MISKEQIAHDLTMVYMRNKYGIDITGDFYISEGDGSGSIATKHFPDVSEPRYIKVRTGEKGRFGIEKKQTVKDGNIVDDLFDEITYAYLQAYSKFYHLICSRDQSPEEENHNE